MPETCWSGWGFRRRHGREMCCSFPGGQQQRVAIARALASEAKVLLADEPTANLDEETAGGITELLRLTAHEMGKCVIVVTHSRALAEEADQVLEMKGGRLKAQS